jgi:Flp pilus assembly protein TadD
MLLMLSTLLLEARGHAQGSASASQVQALYADARAEEQAGHLDEAITKYKAIVHIQPGSAAAYNNLGSLLYRTMRLDDAIHALSRACELEPSLAPPRALLGFSYYQRGDFEAARRELIRARQLAPTDKNVKLYLARSMMELGDLKDAQPLLEQLHLQDPDDQEALYSLGSLYSVLAEMAFGHIQDVAPDSYLLELLMGKASEARQVYADASEHYKRAIARAPEVAELYYHYAHALVQAGNPAEAEAAYTQALHLNPYDYKAAREQASLLVEQDPQSALTLVNRSLQLQPDSSEALLVRGRALLALGEADEALVDLKKVSMIRPDEPSVHYQLARAYRKLGLRQEAQAEDTTFQTMQRQASEETQQRAQEHLNPAQSPVPAQTAPQ